MEAGRGEDSGRKRVTGQEANDERSGAWSKQLESWRPVAQGRPAFSSSDTAWGRAYRRRGPSLTPIPGWSVVDFTSPGGNCSLMGFSGAHVGKRGRDCCRQSRGDL